MNSSFLENFKAFRHCLIRAFLGFMFMVVMLMPFTHELFLVAGAPLLKSLPQGATMLAVGVISPVMGSLKVVLFVGFAISLPWILWQMWIFVAPGLFKKERIATLIFVLSSLCMFALGIVYCYLVVFNFLFPFVANFAPHSVSFAPDIDAYISFVLHMFLAFGLAFETPVAVCFLVRFKIISIEKFKRLRRYLIVGAFALSAVLTPPDVTSQLLLALPLIALFELGLAVATLIFKRREGHLPAAI